jgi:hypothetical protein
MNARKTSAKPRGICNHKGTQRRHKGPRSYIFHFFTILQSPNLRGSVVEIFTLWFSVVEMRRPMRTSVVEMRRPMRTLRLKIITHNERFNGLSHFLSSKD